MKTRPIVYAAVALSAVALSMPTVVQAACSGYVQPQVTVGVVSSADPGSQVTITCTVNWNGGKQGQGTVAVAAGDLDGLGLSEPYSAPATWTTPATPGSYAVTCSTPETSSMMGGLCSYAATGTTNVSVGAAAAPPSIGSISGPAQLLGGVAGVYTVSASDPQSLPLTYAWSADGGSLAPGGAAASWQAPSAPGAYTLTVVATNSLGLSSAPATLVVQSVLAEYQAGLPVAMTLPRRVAVSEAGQIVAIDGRQGAVGQLVWLSARGEPMGLVQLPEFPRAVAYGAGAFWVTTQAGNIFKLDALTGRNLGMLQLQDGPFGAAEGIAYDPTRSTLWVADQGASAVRVIRPDGTTVATLRNAGGATLASVSDVAIDPVRNRAWVLRFSVKYEAYLDPGEPSGDARFLDAFDLDANFVSSQVTAGGAPGQLVRAGGVAVDASGRVYVTDTFQGTVSVFDPSGSFLTTVGRFGFADGLRNPSGLAFMKNGDLLVANTAQGRLDRIGVGVPLPTCAGDADCDGLPDEWELAHGLNPFFAGDALLAFGGTGLTNADVYAYESGTDPLAPSVTVVPSAPTTTPPGLVRLSGTITAPSACGTPGVAWRQVSGPPVTLQGANTATPRFIARTAAVYGFDVSASCLASSGPATHLDILVKDVPPVADAGGLVVASAGTPVRLDATFSSDANGDALTYSWDQVLGRSVAAHTDGSALTIRPRVAGLYRFQLSASGAGATGTAEIPVLVMKGSAPTAIVVASAPEAKVGDAVQLDATASLVTADNQSFVWEQVAGEVAELADVEPGVVSFHPSAPGRYAFEVSVISPNGGLRSPPARVDVFVAAADAALPTVDAANADSNIVAVNTPVSLTASGTGSGFAWRQVAGPAAGLTEADAATATAVAFVPGYYAFEVVAKSGDAVSRPRRVAFEARSGNQPIPVAHASVPGLSPVVGQLVFLDGRASTGAAHFRWTQVEGAWVALSAQASVASFKPPVQGRYVFELVVDDGSVRSAPERVEINVSEQGVQ